MTISRARTLKTVKVGGKLAKGAKGAKAAKEQTADKVEPKM